MSFVMRDSNQSRTETQFLIVLSALVLTFGIPVFLSFQGDKSNVTKTVAKAILTEVPVQVREPSSEKVTTLSQSSTSVTFNLPCNKEPEKKTVDSSFVRLEGTGCGASKKIEIQNVSNGFSASLFFTEGNSFTTDFIDLQEGENELKVHRFQADGTDSLKTVHIHRRAPSSNLATH